MGVFAGIDYTAAAKNEPGITDFNPKNFPAIEKLLEDRSSGLNSTVDPKKAGSQANNSIQTQLKDLGVFDLVEDHKIIEDELTHGVIVPQLIDIMAKILDPGQKTLLDDLTAFFPRSVLIINAFAALVKYQSDAVAGLAINGQTTEQQFLNSFGNFQSVIGKDSTGKLTQQWYTERTDNPPSIVNPWEMRIGGSRFFVPPISVNVSQSFQAGALAGGALRQSNTPKFNSGHSETLIEVTLYFPNHETIWGYNDKGEININFDEGGDSDEVVDQFMSSLRGLITQFKYAPFLPVRNEYLNRTYNITSVALKSLTVQTVEGFPFCLAVNLQMCKFNHKAYLPPIDDFNQAIHWGRFRQYVGRAAQKMNSVVNEGFLIQQLNATDPNAQQPSDADPNQTKTYTIKYESDPTVTFNKTKDFIDGRNFDIYFPIEDPARVFAPDTSDFRQAAEDADSKALEGNGWGLLMGRLGFTVDNNPQSLYDIQYNSRNITYPRSQQDVLREYLKSINAIADQMDSTKLQQFLDKAVKDAGYTGLKKEEYITSLKSQWFDYIFTGWKLTPFFQNYIQNTQLLNGHYLIKEWLVPMDKIAINWSNVLVKGVSVTMGNNLVNQQIQLQADPVFQHIGGKDTSVNVSMTIFGEDDLIKFRLAFEHTNGLARLEHAHGTLGFLGIKNVITALAGVKYVLPLDFQVETIPNFPHVYNVSMTLLDFDIMQQTREDLSSTQQQQLVEAFGKRNPFLRIKQLWSAFNAYPDFPLSVRDDQGNIVGHLNPDFYFRSYQMYDDDIFNWGSPTNQGQTSNTSQAMANAASASTSTTARNNRVEQIQQLLKVLPIGPERTQLQSELAALQTAPTSNELNSATDSGTVKYQDFTTISDKIEAQGGYTHEVHWAMGLFSSTQSEITNIKLDRNGLQIGSTSLNGGDTQYNGSTVSVKDNLAEETLTGASTPDATAYADYQSAHINSDSSPFKQYELMMSDASYRDISGRMIRAFPTYMLWLIDEGGRFAGVKLFDNFYGLQSIIDFSVVSSEDILGDTLVLRLSNLYQKLTTPYAGYLKRTDNSDLSGQDISSYSIPDYLTDVNRNIQSGTNDSYVVSLENIRLKPGVRLHLRMGYDANPNALQTVFNGVITEVRAGDIVEVTAQSDAIELSPFVNTTNKSGSSGKIDGALNCFAKNTPLNIWGGGTVTIGDIVDKGENPILVGKDEDGNIVPSKILDRHNFGPVEKWMKLKLSNRIDKTIRSSHNNMIVTPGHHIIINDKYSQAGKANIGDKVTTLEVTPSDSAMHLIRSSMLGDGCLIKNGRVGAYYSESHCGQNDFIYHINYLLGSTTRKIRSYTSGYGSEGLNIISKTYNSLMDLRQEWYPNGIKIVPEDLSWMDDFSVAKWYMDDGSLTKRITSGAAVFATNGFIREDVNRLADKLREMYGVECIVFYSKGWCLRVNVGKDQSINKMWKAINPYIIPSMQYKLPEEFRDITDLVLIPEGEEIYKDVYATIEKVEWLSSSRPQGGGTQRKAYDITTTTSNYYCRGILVHNTGLWMSEPRDLMVRLLSMGSSSFKESIAAATNGLIFSENKFGIRHFGTILYEPLNDVEKIKNQKRFDTINAAFSNLTGSLTNSGVPVGSDTVVASEQFVNPLGGFFDSALGGAATRSPLLAIVQSMWVNAFRRRDYEVFKRNIYPGNGLGIAQFLGGDTLDGGQTLALAYNADQTGNAINRLTPDLSKTPLVPPGTVAAAQTAQDFQDSVNSTQKSATDPKATADQTNLDKGVQIGKDITGVRLAEDAASVVTGAVSALLDVFSGKSHNPLLQALGIVPGGGPDDDLKGFDEISFRAQTYMKSVWDLFQVCAALLPNYIVAVRPFEDRSTVFYGKPHWLYTSGLIPITAGVGEKDGPKREGPDAALAAQLNAALQKANSFSDVEQQEQFFTTTSDITPLNTTAGMRYSAADLTSLPITAPSGAKIPGPLPTKIGEEMHIAPTSGNHIDGPAPLPKGKSWGEGYNSSGHKSGSGFTLTPEEEVWYMNMPWPYQKMAGSVTNPNYDATKTFDMYKGRRVIISAPKTGKACVCIIGEFGPNGTVARGGRNAGASPDVMNALGINTDDIVYIGFTDDNMQLGPITATASNTAESTAINGSLDADPNAKVALKFALTVEQIKNAVGVDAEQKAAFLATVTLQPNQRFKNTNDSDVIFVYKYGSTPNIVNIPVWIAPSSKDQLKAGSIDVVGIVARRLYDKDYASAFNKSSEAKAADLQIDSSSPYGPSEFFDSRSGVDSSGGRDIGQANSIWNEFRASDGHGFPGFQETKTTLALWNAGYLPNQNDTALFAKPNADRIGNPNSSSVSLEGSDQSNLAGRIQKLGAPVHNNTIEVDTAEHSLDKKAVQEFMDFMWQDPYARAWLVITTSRHSNAPGRTDQWDFNVSPVEELFQQFLVTADLNTFDQKDPKDDTKFSAEAKKQRNQLISWMRSGGHNNQGTDSGNIVNRVVQDVTDLYDQTIGKLWKAISTGISSVLGLYRIALSQLGQGLEAVNTMQKQANVLNKVFNDSIYYAEGSPGSITRLADNPFTREYGEPVIEIREPFQRMHYINSFQHIISNNITENLTGVATVITASSDGNYPVSVYFDKGSPPDRQVEKMVETGLFWDNAQGSGFFGFLHPLLHPIETARGYIKEATGSSDELSSKRVALYHLKESLKDIYMGEVVVIGNPDIRPHDLVFLGDVYERMYGMFEVEQVVHHFTPETGFVTSITPNAIVTINDPSRWSMISWIHSWFAVNDVRTAVKYNMQQSGNSSSEIGSVGVTPQQLAQSLETQFHGHRQYTNGNSALIKDLAATAALGNLGYKTREQAIVEGQARGDINYGKTLGSVVVNSIPGLNMIKDVLKAPFDWIKDNLVDQHGCYIQYLNKNGQPMDAGLSYNQGVAVGTHHSVTLLPGILGLNVNTFQDGHKRITTNDLLKALGWNEVDTLNIQKELSLWVDRTNVQVLDLAGKNPDASVFVRPKVEIVVVTAVHDGDTFYSTPDSTGQTNWRLAGVNAAELPPGQVSIDLQNAQANISLRARSFLIDRLIDQPKAQGALSPTVAIRSNINGQTFNRTAAVVFHNVPDGIDQSAIVDSGAVDAQGNAYPSTVVTQRDKFLFDEASKWPLVEWDSYLEDGKPATINWEVISAGLASVMLFGNQFSTNGSILGLGRGG